MARSSCETADMAWVMLRSRCGLATGDLWPCRGVSLEWSLSWRGPSFDWSLAFDFLRRPVTDLFLTCEYFAGIASSDDTRG